MSNFLKLNVQDPNGGTGTVDFLKDKISGGIGWAMEKGKQAVGTLAGEDGIGAVGEKIKNMVNLATQAITDIIDDPIAFIKNLLGAIRKGFDNFFGNLIEHVSRGLFDYLFNIIEKAGFQIPGTFDLKSILSLVLQIIGTVWNALRNKILARVSAIIQKFGQKAGEVVKIIADIGGDVIAKVITKIVSTQRTVSGIMKKQHQVAKQIIGNIY